MQRKVVLSHLVPYNQLYMMTKCKVKSKAFTGIRAPTRWNQSMGPIAEKPISLSFSHFLDEYVFFSFFHFSNIYIYMCVCVCVCGNSYS
jgi:hypothetical protein